MQSFKIYLNEYKHIGENSCFCGHCETNLKVTDVVVGKHMYPIGQLLVCSCKKSKIFTNTIRNITNLLDYYKGNIKNYTNGFCNDKKCGYCFSYLNPLEDGVDIKDFRADKYGCTKNCVNNQELLIVGGNNLPEGDNTVHFFIDFYKKYYNLLEKLSSTL
jgi:hypothetical protein